MKVIRLIIILSAVLTSALSFSQKQIAVKCMDSVEELEVTIPEGLNIYEYNKNWLDSIPYLMEHVRNGEPWAYENLARCYRYGTGVEKCITNALIYYEKGGINVNELAENAFNSDPSDELGFMNHLLENLYKNNMEIESAIELIGSYQTPLPGWAATIKEMLQKREVEDLETFIMSSIDFEKITGDELAASIIGLMILRPDTPSLKSLPSFPQLLAKLSLAAEKIPVLYCPVGDRYWRLYKDCPRDGLAMRNAFEMYHKAYLNGLLEPRGAVEVLDYRDNNKLYERFPFSNDEIAHLDSLYSKEYRKHFKSSDNVEEGVIREADESPAVLESEAYK